MIGQTIRSYNRTCTSLLSSQLLFSFRNHCMVTLKDSILSVNATSPSPPSPPALYRAWTHKEPLVAHCLLDSRPTRGQCAKVLTTLSVSSSMIRVGLLALYRVERGFVLLQHFTCAILHRSHLYCSVVQSLSPQWVGWLVLVCIAVWLVLVRKQLVVALSLM